MSGLLVMKRLLLGIGAGLLACTAAAESCDQRAAAALEALQADVVGELTADDALRAGAILRTLCAEDVTGADRRLQTIPASERSGSDSLQSEPEPVTIFGVEVRKAPRDSKGNERLRRKH